MLKVTILGCGSSLGVPVIGCNCKVCKSSSSYNKRSRSAIVISNDDTNILVDFGFDIKDQLVRENITKLDGAILTHDHADHVSGLDNLRVFKFLQGRPLDIFVEKDTGDNIFQRYKYLFDREFLKLRKLKYNQNFKIGSINIDCFSQHHDEILSLGLRVKNFIYSTDINAFPEFSEQFLYGAKVWVIDCLDYQTNHAHTGLDQVLKWDEQFKPESIFLTNMGHNIDYFEILERLPPHIKPAYDGFQIIIS